VRPDELRSWIEAETGRPVTAVERVSSGASRATYIVRFDTGDDLVARVDTGDGPMAGTELSLPREAQAYRALAGSAVRIPRLHAVEPEGRALLVDRAAGTHELTELDPEARLAVMDDYLDAVADLHGVEPAGLELAGWRRPDGARGHAMAELDCWEGILRGSTTGPWPRKTHQPRSSIGSPRWENSQSSSAVTRPLSWRKFPGPTSPWHSTVRATVVGAH